jgi:hypothetical protein
MQLITNKRGQIVCSDTYLHEVPQVTSGILLDYITKTGLCWKTVQKRILLWQMDT